MTRRILIIDDEAPIRDMVRFALKLANYSVIEADNASAGLAIIEQEKPDLLLLDWMLPDMEGINFIKVLQKKPSLQTLPIIMLTAKAGEDNKVLGLTAGADDYIVKPFSPRELIARIKTILRRQQKFVDEVPTEKLIHLAPFHINLDEQRLYLNDKVIEIGPIEYKLLLFLIKHRGKVFSRAELLKYVWGNEYLTERTVDVCVRRLRQIFAEQHCDDYIRTARGFGYSFQAASP